MYFFLDRAFPELEPHITADTLRLGCTPVVNLFSKRAEPIKVTQRVTEYPIIPDARTPDEIEVFSVDRVLTTGSGGEDKEFVPLYSCPQVGESRPAARLLGEPSPGTGGPPGTGDVGDRGLSFADRPGFSSRRPGRQHPGGGNDLFQSRLSQRDQPAADAFAGGCAAPRGYCLFGGTDGHMPPEPSAAGRVGLDFASPGGALVDRRRAERRLPGRRTAAPRPSAASSNSTISAAIRRRKSGSPAWPR